MNNICNVLHFLLIKSFENNQITILFALNILGRVQNTKTYMGDYNEKGGYRYQLTSPLFQCTAVVKKSVVVNPDPA